MERLRNNVRWKCIFRNQPDDSDYLPELYINSERNPDKASPETESCINEFQQRTRNGRGNVAANMSGQALHQYKAAGLRDWVKMRYTI